VAGPGLIGPTDQGPLIDARALNKVAAHVADAVVNGGQILTGGKAISGRGHFFAEAPDRDDILNLFIVNHVPLPKEALLTSEDSNDGEIPF
jgi:hypothetical protein